MKKNNLSICSEKGHILVRVVFISATLLALGFLIFFVLRNQQEKHEIDSRKALENCEYGLQETMNRLKEDLSWREGLKEENYTTKLTTTQENDSVVVLTVESKATYGSTTKILKRSIPLKFSVDEDNDTSWAINMQ